MGRGESFACLWRHLLTWINPALAGCSAQDRPGPPSTGLARIVLRRRMDCPGRANQAAPGGLGEGLAGGAGCQSSARASRRALARRRGACRSRSKTAIGSVSAGVPDRRVATAGAARSRWTASPGITRRRRAAALSAARSRWAHGPASRRRRTISRIPGAHGIARKRCHCCARSARRSAAPLQRVAVTCQNARALEAQVSRVSPPTGERLCPIWRLRT